MCSIIYQHTSIINTVVLLHEHVFRLYIGCPRHSPVLLGPYIRLSSPPSMCDTWCVDRVTAVNGHQLVIRILVPINNIVPINRTTQPAINNQQPRRIVCCWLRLFAGSHDHSCPENIRTVQVQISIETLPYVSGHGRHSSLTPVPFRGQVSYNLSALSPHMGLRY